MRSLLESETNESLTQIISLKSTKPKPRNLSVGNTGFYNNLNISLFLTETEDISLSKWKSITLSQKQTRVASVSPSPPSLPPDHSTCSPKYLSGWLLSSSPAEIAIQRRTAARNSRTSRGKMAVVNFAGGRRACVAVAMLLCLSAGVAAALGDGDVPGVLPLPPKPLSDPPDVFPNATSDNVRIVENPVYVTNLSPSEIDDMRNVSFYKPANVTRQAKNSTKKEETENSENSSEELLESVKATISVPVVANGSPKEDAEYIENGDDTEEVKLWKKEQRPGLPIVRGQLAAILAGIFVVMAVIGYVGLMTWRRYLESRYGNREMLINEEEFCTPNDMRNFSL